MDFLKKVWPFSFKERTEVSQLVIAVILQVLIGWGVGFALTLVGGILGGIFAALLSLVGSVISLYFTAGIVFTFLSYFKVLK